MCYCGLNSNEYCLGLLGNKSAESLGLKARGTRLVSSKVVSCYCRLEVGMSVNLVEDTFSEIPACCVNKFSLSVVAVCFPKLYCLTV